MGLKYKIRYDLNHPIIQDCFRIEALRDFSDVKKGQIGGYVSSLENLSQNGDSWIYEDGLVSYDSFVGGNAKVKRGVIRRQTTILGDVFVDLVAKICPLTGEVIITSQEDFLVLNHKNFDATLVVTTAGRVEAEVYYNGGPYGCFCNPIEDYFLAESVDSSNSEETQEAFDCFLKLYKESKFFKGIEQ